MKSFRIEIENLFANFIIFNMFIVLMNTLEKKKYRVNLRNSTR